MVGESGENKFYTCSCSTRKPIGALAPHCAAGDWLQQIHGHQRIFFYLKTELMPTFSKWQTILRSHLPFSLTLSSIFLRSFHNVSHSYHPSAWINRRRAFLFIFSFLQNSLSRGRRHWGAGNTHLSESWSTRNGDKVNLCENKNGIHRRLGIGNGPYTPDTSREMQ